MLSGSSKRVMLICLRPKFRVSFSGICASCRIHLSSAAMSNHLPDGWTEYTNVGKRIPGTRFIAFKVPLKKLFDNRLEPCQRFSTTELIIEIEKQKEELGLVVDLTCTKRYYSSQELPATIKYAKIFTAGRQVPTDEVIYEFKSTVKQFLSENADNEKLIGVHCTHGLNRTGHLVCRYMIDVLGMAPSEAIEKFNKSRGHCIERENYLEDLLQGKPRNNPESDRSMLPKARHQQHISSVNVNSGPAFRPPLCHQQQLWFPGYPFATPNWGPRLSTPLFSHLPGQYIPGPQHGLQQMTGRPPGFAFVNPGLGIPPPVFSQLHMPGPRHHIPHMEENQQQHFRGGPQRKHLKRHFQQQDDEPVNSAPMWGSAPHLPHIYGSNMVNCTDTRASAPQVHGHNAAYLGWQIKKRRDTPGQEDQ